MTRVCGCELTLAWGWEDRMTRVLAVLRLEPSSTRPRSVSRVIESSGTSARYKREMRELFRCLVIMRIHLYLGERRRPVPGW